MNIIVPANTSNLATIANLTLTGQTLINPPQTSLNGGTGLNFNQYYYDTFGPARTLSFLGTPVNGSFITLRANVTGQASLQFPQSNRIGQQGTVTGLNLNLGNQEISWVYANTSWWLADSTSAVNNLSANRAPVVTDDFTSGYAVGSLWVNTGTLQPYECVANTIGAASWFVFGTGSSSGGSSVIPHTVTFSANGNGSPLVTGLQSSFVKVPFAGTLQEWTLTCYPSGSITVDVYQSANGAGVPFLSMSKGGTSPAIAAGAENSSSSFTSWASTTITGLNNLGLTIKTVDGVVQGTTLVLQYQ